MRKFLYGVIALAVCANIALANSFYNASGAPSTGAALVSSTIRNEFASIASGFNLMPTLGGNGNQVVVVNSGGTALTSVLATALPGLTIGSNVQAWDADLDALAAISSTGMLAHTGAGTAAALTLTGTANEITVTNGNGSGTPTFSLPSAMTFTGKTITGGSFSSPAINGTVTTSGLTMPGFTVTGNLIFTDATYDIGASGATRPRDFFLSRNAVVGGTLNVTGVATLGNGSVATTQSVGDNSTKVATTAYADRAGMTAGTTNTASASILANHQYTQAHGLSATPTFLVAYLENTSTDLGFSSGDRVSIGSFNPGNGTTQGITVSSNATNTYISTSTTIVLIPLAGGIAAAIDLSKWKIVVIPYKVG